MERFMSKADILPHLLRRRAALDRSYLVNFFMQDEELDALFSEAVAAPEIGPANFQRKFSQILIKCPGIIWGDEQNWGEKITRLNSLIQTQALEIAQSIAEKYSTDPEASAIELNVPRCTALEPFLHNGLALRVVKNGLDAYCSTVPTTKRLARMANDFARLIIGASSLPLFAEPLVISDSVLNPIDFQHELSEYLERFAASLRLRSRSSTESNVADFITNNSSIISIQILQWIIGGSDSTAENVSVEPQKQPKLTPIRFVKHRDYLLLGPAFQKFDMGLRFIRAKAEIAARSPGSSECTRLLSMLFELESSQPRELRVIRDFRPSNFDSFKHWIEYTTCSKWNWWPFDEPRNLPPRGEAILTWKCGCGTTRQEHMPFQLAERLSRLCLERRHNAGPEGASSHQGLGPHSPVNSQDSTSSQSPRPIDSDDSRSSTDITESEMTSPSEATNDTHITIEGPDLKYVFIIIKTSNSKLVQVEVNNMKAVEFFRNLKAQYVRTRGFFRSWFSIYVYNHCDFVKIQKWNPERFAAHSEFSFPPCEDLEYSYKPKPMKANPIPPEIFKDIFYSCSGSGSLAHQFHFACQPLRNIAEEIMDRLPKRDRPVIASSDAFKLEELWGLATKERRSALRVLIYLVLCTFPTVVFMFAWLFGWTKDGDLQSASTPMTITVAALTLLWTVIYSGTGGD